MVRVLSSVSVATLFAMALAIPVKRDSSSIQADLVRFAKQVGALENALEAYPASECLVASALAIHHDTTGIDSIGRVTNADFETSGPLSEVEGRNILSIIQNILLMIDDALNQLVAKKSAFDALPNGGISALVHQDLTSLNTSTIDLANNAIEAFPPDLKAPATTLRDRLTALFHSAITAYT